MTNPSSSKRKRPFSLKRWYNFNKQKLPLYFTIVAVILFTGFIDFRIDEINFRLDTHIYTLIRVSGLPGAIGTFSLFVIYLLAIVQVFNTVTFSAKRNPATTILTAIITVVQLAAVIVYISIILTEPSRQPSFNLSQLPSAFLSIGVFTGAMIFQIVSTTLTFVYTDWHYVKIED